MHALVLLLALTGVDVQEQPKMGFDKFEKLVVIRSVIEEVDSLRLKGVEVDEDGAIKKEQLDKASTIAGFEIKSLDRETKGDIHLTLKKIDNSLSVIRRIEGNHKPLCRPARRKGKTL